MLEMFSALGEGIFFAMALFIWFVYLPLSPLFLWLGLRTMKIPQRSFWRMILTAVFNWLVLPLPIIGFVIQIFIIKSSYKIGLGKVILTWLIAVIVPLIISILLLLIYHP